MSHPTSKNGIERLLTPKEAAESLRVSLSWLAKARMSGDGPADTVGRAIRYADAALSQWMKSRQRSLPASDSSVPFR